METYNVGDTIAHVDVPPAVWRGEVLETQDCETDWNRDEPHRMYRVLGLDGREDWVCAYDVKRV